MVSSRLVQACFSSVLAVTFGLSAEAAEPPKLDIPPEALQNGLLPIHINQIQKRVRYWMGEIRTDKDITNVPKARATLLTDYRKYNSAEFQYQYARQTAEQAIRTLSQLAKTRGNLRSMREINVALAVSMMPQVATQPALEKLVMHDNAGVRYLGWRGYGRTKMLILAQGPQFIKKMYSSLDKCAAKERSPAVIGAILEMVYVPSQSSVLVEAQTLRKAQSDSFAVFKNIWPRVCRRILHGNIAICETAQKGTVVLSRMANDNGYRSNIKAIAQLLTDAIDCSAIAFDKAKATGPIAQANMYLLRDAEDALNTTTKLRKTHLYKALTDPNEVERGAAVQLASLKWIEDMKDFGVKKPNFQPPATKPSPATEPDK